VIEVAAAFADVVCAEVGLELGATLEDIAAAVDPPWTEVLLEQRQTLVTLTAELSVLAETSRHLMAAGLKAVESALTNLGLRQGTTSLGYDAQGHSEVIAGQARTVVDRSL
jgi:hypothetical protein